ncbi:unnamed protein product [Lactuca saligna]|uniref:Jacalin-type lectin domain-containing protein n=1 Tax=Lactuca saligna TaxID=75948 RepID=A0AA35ZTN8_LACSI|nr:unnamed protein product [Lactuca saligna]
MQQPVSSGGEVGFRASSYLQILCYFLMEKEQYLKMPLKRIILAVMLYVPFCMASLGVSKVGLWGTKSNEDPQNRWAFLLEKDHKLSTAHMVGGWNGGVTFSKVVFEDDEEIIGIDGTLGVSNGEYDGYYIDAIGVYITTSSHKIARVGIWGTKSPGGPQNKWSFQLERNHHLKKITIDHGDLIYSLMFTTKIKGIEKTSNKAGGWNGGDIVSEVTFSPDEEIIAINGTIGLSRGTYVGHTIISSLTFITTKQIHGPYGNVRGTPFNVPWENKSFAGFYGLAGYYIDGIGVYLKPTIYN